MSKLFVPAALLLVGGLGGAALSRGLAQDEEAMMPVPQPTEHHAVLAQDDGTWAAEVKMYMMGPDAEPMTSAGVETNEMMGGLWQISSFEGQVMGMSFEGRGIVGYDADKKKYVGVWVDTMSDYIAKMEGTYDTASKTMTWMVDSRDPMSGEIVQHKHLHKHVSDGVRSMEMYMPNPMAPDETVKMMEITYRRKE